MKNPLPIYDYKDRKVEKDHSIRGEFFRDQTAIIHSMPFRRLKHKTQVFFSLLATTMFAQGLNMFFTVQQLEPQFAKV